jgi:undecaprenyl-diphosphatase
MTLLVAAVLGVLQGLTEFLPISSTAHLVVAGHLLGFDDPNGVFTVMIQFGSILAVMWLYRERLLTVLFGLPSDPSARRFALMILCAFLPAAVVGLVLADFVKSVLYESPLVIATAFVIGGIVMLVVERLRRTATITRVEDTPLGRAVAIGACQTLAVVPGVS